MSLAIAAMLLSGCANKPEAISGTEELNPLISSSYAAADRLLTAGAKQDLLSKNKRVLVASWVDVNQVSRTSIFGKMMAEQLASRLVQQGIAVMEVKLRSSLFITEHNAIENSVFLCNFWGRIRITFIANLGNLDRHRLSNFCYRLRWSGARLHL